MHLSFAAVGFHAQEYGMGANRLPPGVKGRKFQADPLPGSGVA
jgi:hypothetical protein